MRITRAAISLMSPLLIVACRGPLQHSKAGTHKTVGTRHVYQRSGVLRQIALYLPNRVVDLVEIVCVPIGPALWIGPDIRLTRWAQLSAQASVGIGLQWDDRGHSPWVAEVEGTVAFGPWRTGGGVGRVSDVDDWEIAIGAGGMKVGVDAAEFADFLLGWLFLDILKDDYGWQ